MRHGSKSRGEGQGHAQPSGQRVGGLTWDVLLCTPRWVGGMGKVTRGGRAVR